MHRNTEKCVCVWKLAPQTDLRILCIASVGIIKKKDLLLHIEYHRYIEIFLCLWLWCAPLMQSIIACVHAPLERGVHHEFHEYGHMSEVISVSLIHTGL